MLSDLQAEVEIEERNDRRLPQREEGEQRDGKGKKVHKDANRTRGGSSTLCC